MASAQTPALKGKALDEAINASFEATRKEGAGFTVGRIRPEQIDATVESLASAFTTDPIFRSLWPEDSVYERASRVLFRAALRAYGDRVLTAEMDSGEIACCSIFACGGWTAELKELMFSLRHMPSAMSFGGAMSVFWTYTTQLEPMTDGARKRHTKGRPHLYLKYLGTAAVAQGKGIGGALGREFTRIADELGVLCYLESSNRRNVPFYKRLGFVERETGSFRDATLTFMSREPAMVEPAVVEPAVVESLPSQ
eukprot:TRINITY_DN3333_c0_g2_i1.p1 TRINITY_DN3333_c0_g2~~TRINITY_DN3333_c0_g2_i1.p1  ORF type:complete len:274 (+),score=87.57 TRINITY_DN3333_c0_g2_i1:63-824(+)